MLNFAPKSLANMRMESPMHTCACISLPPGPGDPEITSAPNAFFRKSMYLAAFETARWVVNERKPAGMGDIAFAIGTAWQEEKAGFQPAGKLKHAPRLRRAGTFANFHDY